MTDTRTPYEAMHREIKTDANRELSRLVAESLGLDAAEVHDLLLQATGETDDLPYNVVEGPWLSPDDKEPQRE